MLNRKNNFFLSYTDKNGRKVSKLSISAQLELVYYWCKDIPANIIAAITGKSNHTVFNWMNLCQEVPLRMFNKRKQFGGPKTDIRIDYCPLMPLKGKQSLLLFYVKNFCCNKLTYHNFLLQLIIILIINLNRTGCLSYIMLMKKDTFCLKKKIKH